MTPKLSGTFNKDLIVSAVSRAMPDYCFWPNDLVAMKGDGLTHDHIDLGGCGWILRIPRRNQLGMDSDAYLEFQRQCYDFASLSGHAPICKAIVPPQEGLREGALIVQKINGRKPVLPTDWPAIALALGRLHSLPVSSSQAFIQIAKQPFDSQNFLLNELFRPAFDNAELPPGVRGSMARELDAINDFLSRQPVGQHGMAVLGGDSHPANFMIDGRNKAWLVDLEFMLGDVPEIDLADAGLPLTTRLEPTMIPCHDIAARHDFYAAWRRAAPEAVTRHFNDFMPMAERIVNLRTLFWLCDWTLRRQSAEKLTDIPLRTVQNWNDMADTFLTEDGLDLLLDGTFPAIRQQHPFPAP